MVKPVEDSVGEISGLGCWGPWRCRLLGFCDSSVPFCLRKKVLAKGIPLGTRSGMLALRTSAELLVPWDLVHMELPLHLGSGAQVHLLWQWPGVWGQADVCRFPVELGPWCLEITIVT